MDAEAIQQGLADAAATITGLQAFPSVPDTIDPPAFMVDDLEFSYSQSFGGLVECLFTCALFVGRADSDNARAELSGFLAPTGDTSIKA
ncbi:MAG TPA: hypothetical protein VHF06_37835, partial [Pseudonocardiaceae bacterium]|nr:hypothetical protein [Pseudonocardiaceae bacterium]